MAQNHNIAFELYTMIIPWFAKNEFRSGIHESKFMTPVRSQNSSTPRPMVIDLASAAAHLQAPEPQLASVLGQAMPKGCRFTVVIYHLVMTNSSPWKNPNHKWRFLAGKIIYKWAIYTMAMLNNQRVMGISGDFHGDTWVEKWYDSMRSVRFHGILHALTISTGNFMGIH